MAGMRNRACAAAVALMLVAGNAAPGGPDRDYAAIRAAWAEARAAARSDAAAALPRYDALIEMAAGNHGILLSAISVAAKARDKMRLARWLALFVEQGGAFPAEDCAELAAILGAGSEAVLERARENGRGFGGAISLAEIPPELPLIEGIAHDARRGALFVSSVIDRRIERVDATGARHTVLRLAESDGFPMALAFDRRRNRLWAAIDSALFDGDKPGAGGVMRISPGTGAHVLIGAEPGTALHIGDIALGPDGSVYAADSQSGAIYRCASDCTRLGVLVPAGRLRSGQGMAVAPGGKRLYVADYSYGLLAVDLRTGALARVETAAGIALDGIDGIAMRGNKLIAIQNGWVPARVIEIGLDARGMTATTVRVLARGAPAAEEPGQFTLGPGGAILMVANSQWRRMDKPAARRSPPDPTRLVRLIAGRPGH